MNLLVATDFPPDAPGGGPAVIRQMLKGFPGEVHWWSCRPSVRGSSFMVRGSESRQGGGSAEVAGSGWRVAGFEVASFACCPPGKLMPAHKWTRLKAWLMEHIWARVAARSLRRAIERVKPDCVWAIPHDWSILPIGQVMSGGWRLAGKPPRWHVTIQDYPDVHGHGKLWGEERVQRMARLQEAIYAAADTCDATSHPMLDDLERRTGKRGTQMLHQGLEPEDFKYLESLVRRSSFLVDRTSEPDSQSPELPTSNFKHKQQTDNEKPKTKNQEPIKIAYAGTILREPEFALFVNLLKTLRSKNHELTTKNQEPRTSNIELHLFSAHSYSSRPWFEPEWMFEHGNLPERELVTELRNYDWGFIPMALDDDDPRYNRFSFPTKFITYLAAGLPPIVMGHPDSSVMKMAESYEVGVRMPGADGVASCELRVAGMDGKLGDKGREATVGRPKEPSEIEKLFHGRALHIDIILRCAMDEFDAVRMRRSLHNNLSMSLDA